MKSSLNNGLGELHIAEVQLLKLIRNRFRFGQITIKTHEGLPKDILRFVETVRVGLSTDKDLLPPDIEGDII